MEREPDSLVEQVLDWEYRKALADGSAPVFLSGGKDWEGWKEFEEAFPEAADEP